ncbi:MAG: AraC family transcriptional regulator [Pseudomonadota bacterium]
MSWRTTVLLVTGVPALIAAVMIVLNAREVAAAKLFLAMIVAWVMFTMPYIIGFSGAYQAYPWLTFFPFNTELWIGPLWLLTVRALTSELLPQRWWLWLVPGLVQTLYYTSLFFGVGPNWGIGAEAAEAKFAFSDAFHVPYIVPIETALGLGLIAFAAWDSYVRIKLYREWVGEEHSNADRVDLAWLQHAGAAIIGLAMVWLASDVAATIFGRLSYITNFNFYAISGVVVLWLSLQFLSRSDRRFPKQLASDPAEPADAVEPEDTQPAPAPPRLDLARIEAKVREGQWHFDQDLTLGELARRVGTNASALSAALNAREDGNFTSFINGLRVEAVCDKLRAAGDAGDTGGSAAPNFLDLALDCGFGSKATFNRAFKRHTGQSPREWLQANRALEAA